MRTIVIASQKGGTGKTTTAINMSAALVRKERKVLLIDMDPQANASIGLNIKTYELEKTIYNVLLDKKIKLEDVIINMGKNFDLAPSDIVLSGAEHELAGLIGRELQLTNAIKELNITYDYIIVDNPPSLGLLTFNSLVACKELIIPTEMSFFALHGLAKLLEVVEIIKNKLHHPMEFYVLATLYDSRTNVCNEVLDNLKNNFKNMFKTIINVNVKLKESASKGVSIFDYDPSCRGAIDYSNLADEIIKQEKRS